MTIDGIVTTILVIHLEQNSFSHIFPSSLRPLRSIAWIWIRGEIFLFEHCIEQDWRNKLWASADIACELKRLSEIGWHEIAAIYAFLRAALHESKHSVRPILPVLDR